jgi:putative FmdB family regulatory protein
MPLYEYACHRCGKTFEVRQKFSDLPLTTHEGCGGAVERLLSPPALQFKGSGWYVTDYARDGKSPAGSEKKAKPEGKAESKTETKSEPKTESKSESKPSAPASSS